MKRRLLRYVAHGLVFPVRLGDLAKRLDGVEILSYAVVLLSLRCWSNDACRMEMLTAVLLVGAES